MAMEHQGAGAPPLTERVEVHVARLDVVPIEGRIAALTRTEAHHAWLVERGESLATRGARADWFDGAVALGATPAGRRAEAVAKVECLRGALDAGFAVDAVLDGEEDVVAMVVAAAAGEADRWSLPVAVGRPSPEGRRTGMEPSPADLDRYRGIGGGRTVHESRERVGIAERDLIEVRRSSDAKGVEGALERLRLDVLRAVATPVSSVDGLEAKQAILCRHADLCEPAWLIDPMIGAPLRLDYQSLELTPSELVRLRSQLPLDPRRGAPGTPAGGPEQGNHSDAPPTCGACPAGKVVDERRIPTTSPVGVGNDGRV